MSTLPLPADSLKKRLVRYADQPQGLAALNSDQMVQIFRQVRKLIEKESLAEVYPSTKLFADWLQHNELGNPVAMKLIERLNRDIADMGAVELVVPAALGLSDLRSELIDLFARYGLSDELLETGSLWMRFGSLLLEEIVDVPITFPRVIGNQGKAIETLNRIFEHSIAAYGDPAPGKPMWFDRLLVEVDEETDDFLWRLEFAFVDDSRWGVRGRLYLTDSRPFRVNDLGLSLTAPPELRRRAAEKVIAERPQGRLFIVKPAPNSNPASGQPTG